MKPLSLSSARRFFVPGVIAATALLSTGSLAVGGCGGASKQDVLGSDPAASSSGGTSGTSGASGTSGTSGAADASAACPQETEPNNSRATANTVAPTICGVINPNGESDFLTFQLKPTSTSLAITFTGQVSLKVEAGGTTVTLGGGGSGVVGFFKGQRYLIEVKATVDGAVPWRVDLIEK